MVRLTYVKFTSMLLVLLLFLNSGPRQIIETNPGVFPGHLQEHVRPSAPDLQFDALLRELQTAVSAANPDLDDIGELEDQLAEEHKNVLAYFREQEKALRRAGVDRAAADRLETAVAGYQVDYQEMMNHLDGVLFTEGDAASLDQLTAFLSERLPNISLTNTFSAEAMPHRALQADPAATAATESWNRVSAATNSDVKRRQSKPISSLDDDPPAPEDLAETIEIQFTAEITQLAASLNHNPVEMHNWVRNNIDFVPTWGSIQGASLCLETRLCNAFDTSSLLMALLRASGIPARYQMGSVSVPINEFMNWGGGFTDEETAASLFATAGVPGVVRRVDATGTVVAVRLQHVWVSAYVDYIPSRGVVHSKGDTWVDLDPSFKLYDYSNEIALFSPGDDYFQTYHDQVVASATIDPVTGAITGIDSTLAQTYIQTTGQHVSTVINGVFPPDATVNNFYEQQQAHVLLDLPILAANLPYSVLSEGVAFAAIPETLQHQVTFYLDGAELYTGSTAAMGRQRVAFSYLAATDTDARVMASFVPFDNNGELDMDNLPASLPAIVQLVPDLRIGGQTVAQSSPVLMGSVQQLRIDFYAPTVQTPAVVNDVNAGEYLAVGFNLARILEPQIVDNHSFITQHKNDIDTFVTSNDFTNYVPQETVDAIFQTQIWSWFASVDYKSQLLAEAAGIHYIRYPSVGMFFFDLQPNTLFGVPTSVSLAGQKMDVDRDMIVAMSRDGDAAKAINFTFITGIQGSALEAEIPAWLLSTPDNQIEGISTTHALWLANDQQIPVYTINETNAGVTIPRLQISDSDIQMVRDAVNAGMTVVIPEQDVSFHGEAYLPMIIIDGDTGSSAFLIGGAGGAMWWFQTIVFAIWFGLMAAILVGAFLCPPCAVIVGAALLITPLPWLFLILTALVEMTTPGAITGIFTDSPGALIQGVLEYLGFISGSLLTGPGAIVAVAITMIQAIVQMVQSFYQLFTCPGCPPRAGLPTGHILTVAFFRATKQFQLRRDDGRIVRGDDAIEVL